MSRCVLCHFSNAVQVPYIPVQSCTMPKLGQKTGSWSLRQALRIRNRQTDPCAKDQKCPGSAPCNSTFRKWNKHVPQNNSTLDLNTLNYVLLCLHLPPSLPPSLSLSLSLSLGKAVRWELVKHRWYYRNIHEQSWAHVLISKIDIWSAS